MAMVLVVANDRETRWVPEQVLGLPELSGRAPLRAVAEQPPALVPRDLRPRGESGFALRRRETRTVALSVAPGSRGEAAVAGSDAFVAAPFALDPLLALVRRWPPAAGAR
jgi:hypothetical protein